MVIPIGEINGRLPKVTPEQPIITLKDLYELLGTKRAFKRYRGCWDLLPSAFTLADLDSAAIEIRKYLKEGFAATLLIEKAASCQIVYENLNRDKLLRLLRCIHSLRRELLEVNSEENTSEKEQYPQE